MNKSKSPSNELSMPLVRGPFRGVLLTFHKDTDFKSFKDTYSKLTFNHNNFYKSISDRHKCIIYFKNPYDAATAIRAYKSDNNFSISLYQDQLSKTLHPEVLYIVGNICQALSKTITLLRGKVLTQSKVGVQAKFEDFRAAAIAHEELRKNVQVKFAYRSEVPNLQESSTELSSTTHSPCAKITLRTINKTPEAQIKIQDDIYELVAKHKDYMEYLKEELKYAVRELSDDEIEPNSSKTPDIPESPDSENISWNEQVLNEEKHQDLKNKEHKRSDNMAKLKKILEEMENEPKPE